VHDSQRVSDVTDRRLHGASYPPMLGAWWWLPSAFAILALLLLLAVPAIVDRRVGRLRNELTGGSEHARVLLNDLEASFASQLLVRNSALAPNATPSFATPTHLEGDESGLNAVVREISPEAVRLYADLNARLGAWGVAGHDGSARSAQDGLDLLASAERLDNYLSDLSDAQRQEVRRLERFYVVTPAVLAPVALIAIIIVMWSGRRVLPFARLAEDERLQVVRAGEARAALLRGVTHDVKNPLGAAAGYAQLLSEGVVGPLAAPQREMVVRINRLVQTAVQTVTDLLELARADGALHIEYASTDLATIAREVVEDHEGMAREHGIELAVSLQETPIVTDPQRVRQILANLVTNAIKYTPAGGNVRVSTAHNGSGARAGEQVGIEVRDTGPGIPRDLQGKVFEEFFRVRGTAPAENSGNGLGLAISRRIARLLGGDVTFADSESGGAVFTLWFNAPRGQAN
jgi:signal transduction histidine kinase